MRSDRYVHPEFGHLAPRSQWRRELRVRFVSMLLGIGVAAAAAAALGWAHRHGESGSASPLANREAAATFSLPNAQAEAIDRKRVEQVGINTDRARTVEAARRVEVGTACDADAGCGSDAHSAGKPHASGLRAANERPPIAGVLVGRGDPPGGTHAAASWADVPAGTMPASSPKPAPGQLEQLTDNNKPELKYPAGHVVPRLPCATAERAVPPDQCRPSGTNQA